jgi:three-Cys-motif partner protein
MDSDNLPVGEVGEWVSEKHDYLKRYIDVSRAARRHFLNGKNGIRPGGATYTDLFCGAGRSRIKNSGELVDGSAIVAWKASVASSTPFSKIYVCDADQDNLDACVKRLKALGAPVEGFALEAIDAAPKVAQSILDQHPYGLHIAFLDPFNLETLDFSLIQQLSKVKRMDLLIHVSAMDLQRNLLSNLDSKKSIFDRFSPGWRESVDTQGTQEVVRVRLLEFWRTKLATLNVWPSSKHQLITGSIGQPLYWLILAASNELAHKFWNTASNPEGQGSLGF